MKINETALIERIDTTLDESLVNRLRVVGIEIGQNIQLLRKTPIGGPFVFQVSDGVFSLERELAEKIFISKD